MGFSEMAARRKKSKDLKNELKQLKKDMIAGGSDKGTVAGQMKELQEVIELGDSLQEEYEAAKEHLELAKGRIGHLLECMGESPAAEVQASLKELVQELDLIYHECLIRSDDADFESTTVCLKRLVQAYDGNASIMLRSELENIKAVLDDAAGFGMPDFYALAYYFLHESREELREVENEQRNRLVKEYFKEHFLDELLAESERTGVAERVRELL